MTVQVRRHVSTVHIRRCPYVKNDAASKHGAKASVPPGTKFELLEWVACLNSRRHQILQVNLFEPV